jgi:four helix bundle protein
VREVVEKPHKKLKAWQLAMDIVIDIYKITARFPADEKFGLVSQMRRSGVSVPSNIAEGAGRNTKKEFVNFLHIAQGSLSELDTQLELARRLEFVDKITWKKLDDKLIEEDKVLSGLIRSQKEIL